MAAYHRVYDSRHLQADCQEPGSAPGPTLCSVIEYGLLFLQCVFQIATSFLTFISQGSVATHLRCGGRFEYNFVGNLPLSLASKEV